MSAFTAHSLPARWKLLNLVPMARLELARLSPPPPQDGVSTNSTTSAKASRAGSAISGSPLPWMREPEPEFRLAWVLPAGLAPSAPPSLPCFQSYDPKYR